MFMSNLPLKGARRPRRGPFHNLCPWKATQSHGPGSALIAFVMPQSRSAVLISPTQPDLVRCPHLTLENEEFPSVHLWLYELQISSFYPMWDGVSHYDFVYKLVSTLLCAITRFNPTSGSNFRAKYQFSKLYL